MSDLDKIIFGKKKFSDIFQEIYNNQIKKETQISSLISELKPLVQDIGDATLVVPLIKEYLEIGVKNDEQLIKMATIIQRLIQSSSSGKDDGGDGTGLSEAEKKQLMDELEELHNKK